MSIAWNTNRRARDYNEGDTSPQQKNLLGKGSTVVIGSRSMPAIRSSRRIAPLES